MRPSWHDRVRPIAEAIIRNQVTPGVVIAVARGSDAPEFLAAGTDADGRALREDSLLPEASITKLATALAVLRLVADAKLALDARWRATCRTPPRRAMV